jgi:iduronate 2-sulfatase
MIMAIACLRQQQNLCLLSCLALVQLYVVHDQAVGADKLNVLFIASDDMRPQLGCYGDPTVQSPNVDALARRGMVFKRSYVQQALCSPSRISMLSGRYPATTGIFEIGRTLRDTMPDITTMPQHFKNHGYHTRSLGKIYHVGIDDDASWTVPAWHSKKPRTSKTTQEAVAKFLADAKANGIEVPQQGKGNRNSAIPAFESVDCDDVDLLDGDCAINAVEQLREHAKSPNQPFFLAVGFANPHVPWISPKKYWELYNQNTLPMATNEYLPKDSPPFAATSGADFYWYKDVPQVSGDKLPESFKRECLHGYFAAISYVDAQVGRLLRTLDETGLAKNTIVVFWSDHGYYMGEHTWWGAKHNNYEGATRNCLIIAIPNQRTAGQSTEAIAQSVDLAPTLTDLCGLPAHDGFQGRSLKPVLEDPTAQVNEAAYSWYPKQGYLGVAVRTNDWRYVEWTKPGASVERELFDMRRDPQNNINVATDVKHERILSHLSERLREKFPVQEFKAPGAKPPRPNQRNKTGS